MNGALKSNASSADGTWDVVTLGETMLRLTPPGYERFEQSSSVELHVGGSESNTAVGLARLGHRVCWLSRLTDNPIGRLIANSIAGQGVDVSHVIWTGNDRIGTYYLERGQAPRRSEVFYDRADSAIARITPGELPEGCFATTQARYFHTTGITLGISAAAADTAVLAARRARGAGWNVSFDINFRARLWKPEECVETCERLIEYADLIFLPLRDAVNLYDLRNSDARQACEQLQRRWKNRIVVLTMGSDGAAAVDAAGNFYHQPAYTAVEVERLGGGDAFSAGFLSAQLRQLSLPESLRWGSAAAALKYTIPGDLPLFERSAVQALVQASDQRSSTIDR